MTDLCTALADALRKCAEKWPIKFMLNDDENILYCASGGGADLESLDTPSLFGLDDMDAVAAALGMRFTVEMDEYGAYWYTIYMPEETGEWGTLSVDVCEHDSKRTASLAALLAIITHALQEDGK